VLNTLFLPEGYTNEYRYKYAGQTRHVNPAVYSQLPQLRPGTESVVCFIDRFSAAGYDYHPLRRCTFVSYREASDYIFFRVRLGAYLYPRDQPKFRQDLVAALGRFGLPKLTDNNPENTSDGSYAILTESLFGRTEEYLKDDEAWTVAVEALSKTRALSTTSEQSPVFTRASIHPIASANKPETPTVLQGTAIYELKRDRPYEFLLTYRFPRQRVDQTAKARAEVRLGDNARVLGQAEIIIDSHANSVPVRFQCKRYAEEGSGAISLAAVDDQGQPKILVSDSSLQYEFRESTLFWAKAVTALFVFTLAGAFIGIDLSKLSPFSVHTLFTAAWPKFTAGVVQTAALFWIFRLIGSKLV
jgi:hypothetical protein